MALPGPDQCPEKGPGSPIAVVGVWALLQHHQAIFFFIELILDYANPGQLEEEAGRQNGDCHGVARLQAAPLVQPVPGRDQPGVRASWDLSRRGARALQGCGRSWAVRTRLKALAA